MSKYRHEFKYLCSENDILCIQFRIAPLMQIDSHIDETMMYTIRSLYFDTYNNGCYMDNINGVEPREKFRIRIYNADDSFIRLELKRKEHGMTQKLSCTLTREQCVRIIEGKLLSPYETDNALYRKFCILQRTHLLRPKIIVEYDRIPYIYKNGNVRATFDRNVRSSSQFEGFFEERIPTRSVMQGGQHIMEVKFDEYIPDFIHHAIQTSHLQRTAVSKYCLSRKYNLR